MLDAIQRLKEGHEFRSAGLFLRAANKSFELEWEVLGLAQDALEAGDNEAADALFGLAAKLESTGDSSFLAGWRASRAGFAARTAGRGLVVIGFGLDFASGIDKYGPAGSFVHAGVTTAAGVAGGWAAAAGCALAGAETGGIVWAACGAVGAYLTARAASTAIDGYLEQYWDMQVKGVACMSGFMFTPACGG